MRLDLSSLALSQRADDWTSVTALWPLQGGYRLGARTLPLVLRERQELIKDHVWLDAGTPVQAVHPSAGGVEVSRPQAWINGSSPVFSRVVPCADLHLTAATTRRARA